MTRKKRQPQIAQISQIGLLNVREQAGTGGAANAAPRGGIRPVDMSRRSQSFAAHVRRSDPATAGREAAGTGPLLGNLRDLRNLRFQMDN